MQATAADILANGVPAAGAQQPELPAVNVPDVAAAIDRDTRSMGLRGWVSQNIGHLGAMGVVCLVFVLQNRDAAQTAREDRVMFREELKTMREGTESRYIRTENTHGKAMEKMGATIERAVSGMEKATKALEKTAEKLPGGGQ